MLNNGIEHFEMFPLEFCQIDIIAEREVYWMGFFNSTDPKLGYNIREDSKGGMIVSVQTSLKISENLKRQWSSGMRSGHSEKMKDNWRNNSHRKMRQSDLSRKIKTKYVYDVTFPNGDTEENCRYLRIKELKLTSILSAFHRQNKNTVTVKSHTITRRHQNALV